MCGILGIVSNSKIEKDIFFNAVHALDHRGPDDSGLWFSSDNLNICLGHTRLSIIDLTNNSSQPMKDKSGNFIIIFNGEIYNYKTIRKELAKSGIKFTTTGDTEVLLEAYKFWGTNCLKKLVGMFSFAIYDIKSQKIFLARDRAGEKPLFYFYNGSDFIFSSELKGLLKFPQVEKRINLESLDIFLAEGYVPNDRCIIKKIKKLPAAHSMTYDVLSNQIKIERYWDLPKIDYKTNIPTHDIVNELELLINNSVTNQLEADVPVGILLSGGLDSSLVTALAAKNKEKINTFTISFSKNPQFDETKHARIIAEHYSTNHFELEAEESSIDLLPLLAKQFDEPLIDTSTIPTYLVTKLVRQHCTVALGGDGGDELFGGYRHYSRLLFLQKNSKYFSHRMREKISKLLISLSKKHRGNNWLEALGTNLNQDLPRVASYFNQNERKQLISNSRGGNFIAENNWKERVPYTENLLDRATRMDFYNYLCEDILVKVDRASMLNSLEMRAPLLDHRIIEFAFQKIPMRLKSTHNQRKIILQMLGKKILPKKFVFNRKQGFNVPINDWFKSKEWNIFLKDVLLDPSQNIFDHSYIEQLINNHIDGDLQGERLYGLLMFELWRKEYKIKNL